MATNSVPGWHHTALWQETCRIPAVVRATLDAAAGFDELARYLSSAPGRVVVTGNGAAYYAGMTLWLTSVQSPAVRPHIVVAPAGVVCGQAFSWRPDDTVLVVSSSGELRDVVELAAARPKLRLAVVTSSPGSSLGRVADVAACVTVESQRAVTHTQAYAANVAAVLAVWARVTDDRTLGAAVEDSPAACQEAQERALDWVDAAAGAVGEVTAGVVFGSDVGWAAAMEAALLFKEVAGLPVEGMDTREGGTTGMYALSAQHMVLSLPTVPADRLMTEAEDTCRRAGAAVLTTPTAGIADGRLAALTTFAPAAALATVLALRAGRDVDAPAWTDAYYATARVSSEEQQ
jgi:fructoselysine-6-P-deglycase FrlB-like protein